MRVGRSLGYLLIIVQIMWVIRAFVLLFRMVYSSVLGMGLLKGLERSFELRK